MSLMTLTSRRPAEAVIRKTCARKNASEIDLPAEETALRPRVSVEVIGDVPHVTVDPVLTDALGRDAPQRGLHVLQMRGRRLRPVKAPHHHRRLTDLTLRHPANLVLVKPRRDLLRPTEITPVYLLELALTHAPDSSLAPAPLSVPLTSGSPSPTALASTRSTPLTLAHHHAVGHAGPRRPSERTQC